MLGTVVVHIGRSTKAFVQRGFGDAFRRDAGSDPIAERWTYSSQDLSFRSSAPPDARGRWTIELMSCSPPPRPGAYDGQRLEFGFDTHGRVTEMHIWRDYLPLTDDSEF